MQAGGLSYKVPTGRRDGRVSQASHALNLPGPGDSVDLQKQKCATKGLNTQDLVTLVGKFTFSNQEKKKTVTSLRCTLKLFI